MQIVPASLTPMTDMLLVDTLAAPVLTFDAYGIGSSQS